MRTYKTEKVEQEVERLEKVICDRCKKTIKMPNDYTLAGGVISLSAGYGSRHDTGFGSVPVFDVCDECITTLLKEFEHIEPEVEE